MDEAARISPSRRLRTEFGAVRDLTLASILAAPVEFARRLFGPRDLVAAARTLGRRMPQRSGVRLAKLRGAIRLVDRLVPGGPNCFRRCLLETALDRGAAEEKIVLGLKAHGGPGSGHAWLADAEEAGRYDAEIVL